MTNVDKLKELHIDNIAIMLDECFKIKDKYKDNYCERCEKIHNGCPNEINRCCNRTSREIIIDWLEQECKFLL